MLGKGVGRSRQQGNGIVVAHQNDLGVGVQGLQLLEQGLKVGQGRGLALGADLCNAAVQQLQQGFALLSRDVQRVQVLIIRDRDYNVASRCIGTPTVRIVLRNLLPYLVSVIMLRMALTIPEAIGNEVFITYIGLGLSVETPSLGNLVNDGRKVMMQAGLRYQLLYPTLILSFVTIAFYLIGNAFSDAADPKNHLQ